MLWGICCILLLAATGRLSRAIPAPSSPPQSEPRFEALRNAIQDLLQTHGDRYPDGPLYLRDLQALQDEAKAGNPTVLGRFQALQRRALLANPVLDHLQILAVKRRRTPYQPTAQDQLIGYSASAGLEVGMPSNHECNSSLSNLGWDNELVIFPAQQPQQIPRTLYRPAHAGYVGETDLHWQGDRLLFTQSDPINWKIWEIRTDGTELRQVSHLPEDVDAFDACYLPDGGILFGSTASYQAVPCWHGQKWVNNLYRMNRDGTGVRQLCFDQDHDFHPVVLPNGQVLYHRWDYTGINHIFLRQLMVMNPDGTGQRAVYGSGSWFPNALYFPRPLPGQAERFLAILSGYHGVHRMGQLVMVDTRQGWREAQGLVRRISGGGQPIAPAVRDNLVDQDWPKFLHPFPLSDKHYLVACLPDRSSQWGIYLADAFDNLVLLRQDPDWALLEPVALHPSPTPPVLPDRTRPDQDHGQVYLHDIYRGPGLTGVPRGTIRQLRVLAYHFGYRGLAGPDKIGYGGPWEVMQILGTVPVNCDGSAVFNAPARTPLAVQALDQEGKAVQLMRSWFTLMPGETLSCVGCHETPYETPTPQLAQAAAGAPAEIVNWHGPPRGFDFAREVQPVLDAYCVSCHDGRPQARPDLRAEDQVPGYRGTRISEMAINRLDPQMREATGGYLKYTPAYEALLPYVRRVGIEDDVSLLVPAEFHADTSPLIQMLRKEHQGVALPSEAWDRLVTWIDLNAPCHGTWGEVYPIPHQAHPRRMALRRQFGGPRQDPEALPDLPPLKLPSPTDSPKPSPQPVTIPNWPLSPETARRQQTELGDTFLTVDLGDGLTMSLARIPAGEFIMGDAQGQPDEWPLARVVVPRPFWMGTHEVNNQQFRQFDSTHDPRYYAKRHARSDDQGLPLNQPAQPAVRVSWEQAMAFCDWLARRTGLRFSLPTEAQWEYACRAGSAKPLHYGTIDADFSQHANLADQSFSHGWVKDHKQVTGGLEHLVLEGAVLSQSRWQDAAVVTAPVGRYLPNPWGLHDMHGNAAEWTRSNYIPYPYQSDDGRNDLPSGTRKVVRGGSFFDPPQRARAAHRLGYPSWQRIFNVGFRVVCEDTPLAAP